MNYNRKFPSMYWYISHLLREYIMSKMIPTTTNRTPRPPNIKRRKVVVSVPPPLDPLFAAGVPLLAGCVASVVGVAVGATVGVMPGVGVIPGVGVAACVSVKPG